MKRAVLVLALVAVACGPKESVVAAIRQTVDQARTPPRVQIDIVTEKPDPSPAELQLQQTIETRIEKEHVAHVVNDGSGPGYVRINVEIDPKDRATANEKLRAILRDAGVSDRSVVKVLQP
ncbi:MAG TPA: hypothetical protein VL284_16200 [Thermoanaerobaculia bacterium]|nr:hypothetical protein [Thermoanaerobaculia bacterium]